MRYRGTKLYLLCFWRFLMRKRHFYDAELRNFLKYFTKTCLKVLLEGAFLGWHVGFGSRKWFGAGVPDVLFTNCLSCAFLEKIVVCWGNLKSSQHSGGRSQNNWKTNWIWVRISFWILDSVFWILSSQFPQNASFAIGSVVIL